MKSRLCLWLTVLCCILSFGVLAEERITIVATNFPCYDTAKVIAGDYADIIMLLPPGSESHSFEPTPADIIAIQESDLFFYVGGESDTWVENLLESFGEDAPVTLRMSDCVETLEEETSASMMESEAHDEEHDEEHDGEHEEEEHRGHHHGEEIEMDEHVWTSPVNMMKISRCLTERLSQLVPELAPAFELNLNAYLTQLTELDEQFRQTVSSAGFHTLIFADRFPFLYFVKEYGLDYDAAFPGCSEDSEPSVHTVISLIDRVRAEGIPAVFYIELSSQRTAEIVAEETGAKKLLFHSCHNVSEQEIEDGASYLSLMTRNCQTLKEALNP